jgi:hypothetical protein
MRCFGIALCVLLSAGTHAIAQTHDPHNAATWYQRAIDQYMQLPQSQRDLLSNQWDPAAGPPPPELRAALSNVQGILQNLQRGSMQEYSDFNLDYSQGFELMMPQLNQLRQLTRVARNDVLVKLVDGDSSGASDRLASLYRMSSHNGDDRIIISSLVGQAVFKAADDYVQLGLDRGVFSQTDAVKLLGAAKTLGADDPFAYVEAIAGEQEVFVTYMDKFTGPEERARLVGMIYGNTADGGQADREALLAADEQQFHAMIDEYDGVMNRVVEIFSMKDPEAAKTAMKGLESEMEQDKHGALAHMLLPAFGKVFERREQSRTMLADRIAVLEKLAAGEVKPEEIANAAIWYLRGIELLERIDPAQLAAIRALAGNTAGEISEELSATLSGHACQEVIDIFRDGSLKKRCDFAFVAGFGSAGGTPPLAPEYDPGMHDALRLLRADAVRLLRAGDTSSAADRLATTFRVVGHLGGDPHLASALIAHCDFNAALSIIETAFQSQLFTSDEKLRLLESVERISRKDPFGYIGAVMRTRDSLAARFDRIVVRDEAQREQFKLQSERIKAFSGDQLLYVLTIFDTMRAAAAPAVTPANGATVPADPLRRLDDVFSWQNLEAVRDDASKVAPRLAENDWDIFDTRSIPAVAKGGVGEQMRRARSDVRRAHVLLNPPARAELPTASEPSRSDPDSKP